MTLTNSTMRNFITTATPLFRGRDGREGARQDQTSLGWTIPSRSSPVFGRDDASGVEKPTPGRIEKVTVVSSL